ncbi:MAG: hypothetical protein Q4B26_12095 [Eubacteriales bacterium]|nr:hypothetical protein [Eubacteriales bacterium]
MAYIKIHDGEILNTYQTFAIYYSEEYEAIIFASAKRDHAVHYSSKERAEKAIEDIFVNLENSERAFEVKSDADFDEEEQYALDVKLYHQRMREYQERLNVFNQEQKKHNAIFNEYRRQYNKMCVPYGGWHIDDFVSVEDLKKFLEVAIPEFEREGKRIGGKKIIAILSELKIDRWVNPIPDPVGEIP